MRATGHLQEYASVFVLPVRGGRSRLSSGRASGRSELSSGWDSGRSEMSSGRASGRSELRSLEERRARDGRSECRRDRVRVCLRRVLRREEWRAKRAEQRWRTRRKRLRRRTVHWQRVIVIRGLRQRRARLRRRVSDGAHLVEANQQLVECRQLCRGLRGDLLGELRNGIHEDSGGRRRVRDRDWSNTRNRRRDLEEVLRSRASRAGGRLVGNRRMLVRALEILERRRRGRGDG
ncbi:Uncharacterised protein [Candidatus Norongarragalina meridionalis]|nr:Uncharacterised protein [Candidatus Norongarragalina meridionalis]